MLYFCCVCPGMMKYFICIQFFSKWSKLQKLQSVRIIKILLPLTNNNPKHCWNRNAPYDLSILSLSSFYQFHFLLPSLYSLHWLDCVMRGVRLSTNEYIYSYDRQKITCILARRVSDCDLTWRLTSFADISYSLLGCNIFILWCGDCLIKLYWCLLSI